MARRPLLRRWLLIAVLAVVFGLCGVIMLALVGATAGVTGTVLGAVLSVLVVGIVVPVFLWVDRFEAEPWGMLLFAFLWGACVATLGAALLNDLGGYLLGATGGGSPLVAVSVAPVVEESLKATAPLLLLIFRRREIDGVLDGMVYAGLSACGFAFVEDIVYLAGGYADSGEHGLLSTFVVRVLMSPFAHPMFTICTGIGIGIGIAATTPRGPLRWAAPLGGWLCAVFLHALWNSTALLSDTAGSCCMSRCRCRCSSPSSPCWCGRGGTRRARSASSSAHMPTAAGSPRRRWRCSPRCPSAATPADGRLLTAARSASSRCTNSRTPPPSWGCCAPG